MKCKGILGLSRRSYVAILSQTNVFYNCNWLVLKVEKEKTKCANEIRYVISFVHHGITDLNDSYK